MFDDMSTHCFSGAVPCSADTRRVYDTRGLGWDQAYHVSDGCICGTPNGLPPLGG